MQNMVINYNNNVNKPNTINNTSNNISFGHMGKVKDKSNITCFGRKTWALQVIVLIERSKRGTLNTKESDTSHRTSSKY